MYCTCMFVIILGSFLSGSIGSWLARVLVYTYVLSYDATNLCLHSQSRPHIHYSHLPVERIAGELRSCQEGEEDEEEGAPWTDALLECNALKIGWIIKWNDEVRKSSIHLLGLLGKRKTDAISDFDFSVAVLVHEILFCSARACGVGSPIPPL